MYESWHIPGNSSRECSLALETAVLLQLTRYMGCGLTLEALKGQLQFVLVTARSGTCSETRVAWLVTSNRSLVTDFTSVKPPGLEWGWDDYRIEHEFLQQDWSEIISPLYFLAAQAGQHCLSLQPAIRSPFCTAGAWDMRKGNRWKGKHWGLG